MRRVAQPMTSDLCPPVTHAAPGESSSLAPRCWGRIKEQSPDFLTESKSWNKDGDINGGLLIHSRLTVPPDALQGSPHGKGDQRLPHHRPFQHPRLGPSPWRGHPHSSLSHCFLCVALKSLRDHHHPAVLQIHTSLEQRTSWSRLPEPTLGTWGTFSPTLGPRNPLEIPRAGS